MNTLIFGGTRFIGRYLVETMLQQGRNAITLFNRGKTAPNLFPSLETITGDRETDDIEKLSGIPWDRVVDLSCYYPNPLERQLTLMPTVKRYVFISTCSVYDSQHGSDVLTDENGVLYTCTEAQRVDRSWTTYGPRKVACEQVLLQSGLDTVILRPPIVYGPYDYTDRLYYWLYQVFKHDTLLVPEDGNRVISGVYVEDLVNAIIHSLDTDKHDQIYNVVTRPKLSIGGLIETASTILGVKRDIVYISPEVMNAQDIKQWQDMPLYIENNHFTYNGDKITDDLGLNMSDWISSLEASIEFSERSGWPVPNYGMSEEKRQELLKLIN